MRIDPVPPRSARSRAQAGRAGFTLMFAAAALATGVRPIAAADGFPPLRLERVGSGFRQPVGLIPAEDGSGRLFVIEQQGRIQTLAQGRPGSRPWLDLGARVVAGGERGLLGAAFHPRYRDNRRLFVHYTAPEDGLTSVIAELTAAADGTGVDPATERRLLTIRQPYANHNGGQIAFGPDGMLYIGLGDGGSGNDPHDNGQRLDTLLGKILRIDPDGRDNGAYGIPKDNPFVGRRDARPEIWAYGLRNPWRFAFDRANGRLYAGDVGQNAREEIDLIERGRNYGWRVMEGAICTPAIGRSCEAQKFEPPLLDYSRDLGSTVIGGAVYRGRAIPALAGAYLFADYGSGRLFGLRHDGPKLTARATLLETGLAITSFGQDQAGELYVVAHDGGIFKVIAAGAP
jgi:glucose/arabinose dehydrogenase